MARPQRKILLERDMENSTTMAVIEADAYYILTYKNKPFTLRRTSYIVTGLHKNYLKTSYPTQAVADNAVNRLNAIFNTEDFSYIVVGAEQ